VSRRLFLAAALLACGPVLAQVPPPQIGQASKDSVWVPTPERMIRRMLQLADVSKDDLVIDLGSGDGRIPIHAAKHFGARAIGVELEANLVKLARDSARTQGVSHLVEFVQQDLFQADLSKATVVALYISPGVMTQLKPRLLALKPGTRVVSHHFTLEDWEPDETIRVENRTGYLWLVPADIRGRWTLRAAGEELQIEFEQAHQQLRAKGERAGKPVPVIGARLRGTEIAFGSFDRDGAARYFEGRIEDGRMSGQSSGHGIASVTWTATRVSGRP
jgi:SAM-dependent methyltransferase